jgi:kojibiose phosphorylase
VSAVTVPTLPAPEVDDGLEALLGDGDAMAADPLWRLASRGFEPRHESFYETLYSLTNGEFGVRHTVDFDERATVPGFFARGVYGPGVGVRQLVNLPNWLPLGARVDGLALAPGNPGAGGFRRVLDLRAGVVRWGWTEASPDGWHAEVRCAALAHATLPEIGLLAGSIRWSALEGVVELDNVVDCRFGNAYHGGFIPEIVFNSNFTARRVDAGPTGVIAVVRLVDDSTSVVVASELSTRSPLVEREFRERLRIGRRFVVSTGEAGELRFVKTAAIAASSSRRVARHRAGKAIARAAASTARRLYARHAAEWERRWSSGDVVIDGDPEAQSAMRFALFHLLQNQSGAKTFNLGARALSSEYHSGHFFFNTELYVAGYWRLRRPSVARAFLRFRYEGLDAARATARENGFDGAWFPESGDDLGRIAGAHVLVDYRTGEPFYEWSVKEVVHLGCDVTYSLARYLECTRDNAFLHRYGMEMALEAARFALSRMTWDAGAGRFDVRSVMGMDEYHYHVDNNFFTNHMFEWSLRWAAETAERMRAEAPAGWRRLSERIGVTDDEIAGLRRAADLVREPRRRPGSLVYEQHDGYFDLENATDRPKLAAGDSRARLTADEAAASFNLLNFQTQLGRQGDVVMVMSMFPDAFTEAEIAANFDYYEPRTSHESSLSASPHGLVAARLGRVETAYDFFRRATGYNLEFRPRRDYRNGIHLAAYAGAWQVLLEGFAGVRLDGDTVTVRPRLPERWTRLALDFAYRGWRLHLDVAEGRTTVRVREEGPRRLYLRDGGDRRRAHAGAAITLDAISEAGD